MARTDIFKRIKNDKLIESRIQKYRLHFDYLKTCLEFSNDFKVDKSKYIHWKLNLVSKYKFDKWWSQVGKNVFEKEIEQVKEVRTPKQSNTSTYIEVPNNTPTEYAIEKIRDILQSKTSKSTNERLRPLELQIYLETFKLRKQNKKLLEVAKFLREKRLKIIKTHKSRALMKEERTVKFLDRRDMDYYVIQRIILRYNLHAKKILENVSKGIFPGKYS
jgi:outer membrane cobalamin receptor